MSIPFTKLGKFFLYFLRWISSFLLFLFSFWKTYDADVGPLEVVPEAVYTILDFGGFFFLLFVLHGCFMLPYVLID